MERKIQTMSHLLKEQQEVLDLLDFLDSSLESGGISEESYAEIKGEALKKLSRLKKALRTGSLSTSEPLLQTRRQDAAAQARSVLRSVEQSLPEDSEEIAQEESAPRAPQAKSLQEEERAMVDSLETKIEREEEAGDRASLMKTKEDVEALLSFLEESYNDGTLTEKSYEEIKQKNVRRLEIIDRKLANDPSVGRVNVQATERVSRAQEFASQVTPMAPLKKEEAAEPQASPSATEQPLAQQDPEPIPFTQGTPGQKPTLAQEARMIASAVAEAIPKLPSAQQAQAAQPAPAAPAAPAPAPVAAPVQGVSQADFDKLNVELEKMKVKLDGLGEVRTLMEEKIERIMESVGELRSMLFEKESSGKELETKIEKFTNIVQDVEPEKYLKELGKRDRSLQDHDIKIETLQAKAADLAKTTAETRIILDQIGSLKNIAEISRDMSEKLARMDKSVSKNERLAEDVGRVYVELNRKLEEFTLYSARQDAIDESLKEMITVVDQFGSKIDSMAPKDDVRSLKEELKSVKKELVKIKFKALYDVAKMPEKVRDLKKQKEGVELLLESTEEEYRGKNLSDEDYKTIIGANKAKLAEIEKSLEAEVKKLEDAELSQFQDEQPEQQGIQTEGPAKDADKKK